jgi:short-subunit dehydrogenase
MDMNMEILKKTYVVTGATSGIGLASAAALARAGVDVIGVGRSVERCRQAEMTVGSLNPAVRVHYLTADLSQQGDVRRLAVMI